MKSPGEAAYATWCERLNRPRLKRIEPLNLKAWADLPPSVRATWDAVAAAAVAAAIEATRGAK